MASEQSRLDTAAVETIFRGAMRGVAASVAIVALRDGTLRGMTTTSVVSVTMQPPTMMVCVNRAASIHRHLRTGQPISINLLTAGQVDIARAFAGAVPPDERFSHGHWAERDTVPFLNGARASVFCTICDLKPVGSHTMILAAVVHVEAGLDIDPLVYCDGAYRALQSATAPPGVLV